MASFAALPTRCVAPVACSRHAPAVVVPKASARPLSNTFNGVAKRAALVPQIQPAGLKTGLRSPIQRAPLSVSASASGAAAPAPAKFKWGADMKNLVSHPASLPICRGTCQQLAWAQHKCTILVSELAPGLQQLLL
jgi:hypothetical protein